MRTCFPKSPIKFKQSKITFCQNYSEERVVRSILQNHSRLWGFWKKVKGLQARPEFNLRLYLLYSWEYLPFSLVSPGCCILSECVRLRGYTRERGAPVVLTILLLEQYYLCSYQEFNQKKCFSSATLVLEKKVIRQTQSLTTINFNKSIFLFVFHLIPKWVLWGVYEWKFKKDIFIQK